MLGEFVIIVLGVLIALAVDDFRQYRTDREAEVYILEGLGEDVGGDITELRGTSQRSTEHVRAANLLLSLLGDPFAEPHHTAALQDDLPPFSQDSVAYAIRVLSQRSDFDVSDATYREIIASGTLGLIEDPPLRRALARYYVLVADNDDYETLQQESNRTLVLLFRSLGYTPDDLASLSDPIGLISNASGLGVTIRSVRDAGAQQMRIYEDMRAQAAVILAAIQARLDASG